ncbi:HNH endonuclease [Nocardia farcinica]|uniref:NUMOD4 domain-containing protein n=1 Tax=Nocardia farcinica TaxID=37329 RepID=UPI001895CF5D|nr:NUMOD4 domain-containing protein [Nocardia farcinica]MBF6254453.1 HNH endonuclease [Nocardia farcinica]MBF6584384.1 HNH endonuclease [Nocardia farcinica]
MSEEQWRPIAGYEDLYEVSNQGRVRSLYWPTPRVLKPGVTSAGYLLVALHKDGRQTSFHVHRLVLETFAGPPPVGTECCHGPGGPTDNRLTNLRWDTSTENNLDQVRDGTHAGAQKTRCPRGHEYSPDNTYVYKNRRDCKRCIRIRGAEYRTRKAANR